MMRSPRRRHLAWGLTFAPIGAALLGGLWLALSGDEARQQDAEPWRHPQVETTIADLLPAPGAPTTGERDAPASPAP